MHVSWKFIGTQILDILKAVVGAMLIAGALELVRILGGEPATGGNEQITMIGGAYASLKAKFLWSRFG